jgi:M6 family metalloprotease-like protein
VVRRGKIAQATLATLVLCLAGAARARAQSGGGVADIVRRGWIHGHARPPVGFYGVVARDPHAFEFRHGWLERARLVRENRQALRARGAFNLMNAESQLLAASPQTATAVSGTLRYPTFLPFFSNTSAADSALMDSAQVQNKFWGTTTAPPYSVTTYYQEISAGRLTVTGDVIGRGIKLTSPDTFYAGGTYQGQPCQGLCPVSRVPTLILEMLRKADSLGVDFSPYADPATDTVPGIVILDPQVGGECYQVYSPSSKNIWAHRYSLSGWGVGAYTTKSTINGHAVVIDDYIIQGGQGGNGGCTAGQLAPIGTVTHETGHLFGLPDLYDTDPSFLTEGLGHWDLMSSGNEQKPYRPAHMSAWSLSFLGWISEVPVTTTQTITTGPIELSDTAFVVPMAGAPHEFFLLENRQPIGSDSMMHGPGLMIYHLDTTLMRQRMPANVVNAVQPHALRVLEAAGDTGLDCTYPAACNDRGDAGDPFPGTSNNTILGAATRPAATTNTGAFAGVTIDSIQQVVPFGAMRFRVVFGPAQYLARLTVSAGGTVTASPAIDTANGTYFAAGDTVMLTAIPDSGQSFVGWTGDTTSSAPVLKLRMTRSFQVRANFAAPGDIVNELLTGGSPITAQALQALDLLGNNNGRFDLGDLVAWLDRNPGIATSPAIVKLLRRLHQ